MWRGSQETDVGRMSTVHVRMGNAGENGEVVAVILQEFEIRRRCVIPTISFGKKMFRQQAQIVANGEHSAGRTSNRGFPGTRELNHRIEKWQGEGRPRAFEKAAPRHRLAS